jgi:L-seryl-tRNA(Ser) seleniumtransferase
MTYPYRSKILDRLGVRSMINAQNWSTSIGGTYLEPEVLEAMAEVSKTFVNMRDLIDKACRRVAELCKVDAAYITTSAAAGITLCVAACIAGKDPAKWVRLPFTEDPPINGRNQIIIQTNHACYDEQYAAGGGRLIKVGGPIGTKVSELETAINDKTAAIAAGYHYNTTPRGCIPYETLARIAKKHDLPCFCDCAGAFPPYSNLHRLTDLGFDMAIFSGGKGIRGPQDTGLILAGGQRGVELIEEIKKHSSPNMGFGRAFKVSKENIVGLVAALELALSRDEDAEYQRQLDKAKYMASQLEGIPGVYVSVVPNDGKTYEHPLMAHVPTVRIDIEKEALGLKTVRSVYEAMEKGEPGIFIRFPRFEDPEFGPFTSKASVFLFTYFLREGEEKIVAHRMREVLTTQPWRHH